MGESQLVCRESNGRQIPDRDKFSAVEANEALVGSGEAAEVALQICEFCNSTSQLRACVAV